MANCEICGKSRGVSRGSGSVVHKWCARKAAEYGLEPPSSAIKFSSGVVSTPCPPYERIPLSATRALANRIARGIRIKGDGAWNALSKNQDAAMDKEFVLNRLGHVIEHAQKAIARIAGTMPPCDAEEAAEGGDAGAILFGGALLAEYMERKATGEG